MKLSHVIGAVFDRPWYLRPSELALVAELTRMHATGDRLPQSEIDARLEAAAAANGPRRGARTSGSVAVIPIYGLIAPRANLMTAMSGGTTVTSIRSAFREVLADESVGSILFDIDSPGGYVDGIEELATEIREARGQKPIVAIADYTMASAAYYLGSQADEVVASPSSSVGWIGTVAVHTEFSKADEIAGITTTIIRNPEGKFGGNEFEPLSDKARTEMQQSIDDWSAQFVNAVAKGRGVTPAVVRSGFGQGGGMTAARAKAAGLVDRVESFDATVRRLATGKGPVSRQTSASASGPRIEHIDGDGNPISAEEALAALAAPTQAGDATPADDPEVDAPEEAGTPPDRTTEAEAALALARAKVR